MSPPGCWFPKNSQDFLSAIPSVPEPEAYALMVAGLGAMSFVAKRRRRG